MSLAVHRPPASSFLSGGATGRPSPIVSGAGSRKSLPSPGGESVRSNFPFTSEEALGYYVILDFEQVVNIDSTAC
eukprot:GSA25T00003688001.1